MMIGCYVWMMGECAQPSVTLAEATNTAYQMEIRVIWRCENFLEVCLGPCAAQEGLVHLSFAGHRFSLPAIKPCSRGSTLQLGLQVTFDTNPFRVSRPSPAAPSSSCTLISSWVLCLPWNSLFEHSLSPPEPSLTLLQLVAADVVPHPA